MSAAEAALLLEGKSCLFSSSGSRTKRNGERDMGRLAASTKNCRRVFSTALFHGGTPFREVKRWGRTALNGTAALSPGTNRNLVRHYDINSTQKRHFLRRQLGPQHPSTNPIDDPFYPEFSLTPMRHGTKCRKRTRQMIARLQGTDVVKARQLDRNTESS